MLRSAFRRIASLVSLAVVFSSGLLSQTAPPPAGTLPPATYSVASRPPSALFSNVLWRFKPGDDPRFADPDYDDSAWTLLRSAKPWTDQGYEKLTGFAWYRFRIVLPASSEPQSMLLPAIQSGYQCFLNGKLAHAEGALPGRSPARYSIPAVVDLPPPAPAHAETLTVALRVWFDPNLDGSSAGGPVETAIPLASVGESAEMHRKLSDYFALRRQRATVRLGFSLLFLLAGILCFPLFLMARQHKEYFWYGVAATCFGIGSWMNFDWATHAWRISTFSLVGALFDWGTTVGLTLFFTYLLSLKRNWITVLALLAASASSLSSAFAYAGLLGDQANTLLSSIGTAVFSAWVVLSVIRRAAQGMLDARLLLVPVAFDFGKLFLDSLRLEFPLTGEWIESLFNRILLTDPFPVRARDFSAAFVLLAFVSVLILRFARIRREHDRIVADMSAARSIQHLLIPDVLPSVPGLKFEAAYHPAQEVGGDFFQVIPAGPAKTLIVLGDVSGKGLPAAMTVSLVVGIVRTLVEFTTSPGAILAGLNCRLVGRGSGFTTCLAIEIDRNGTLIFANAGQLAPYLNGAEIESEAALPLGILSDLVFPELTLQLAEGDRLTLMTDGIPEAASHRELFGFARAEGLSQQSAERIAEAARRFGQTDDITVVSVEYRGDRS